MAWASRIARAALLISLFAAIPLQVGDDRTFTRAVAAGAVVSSSSCKIDMTHFPGQRRAQHDNALKIVIKLKRETSEAHLNHSEVHVEGEKTHKKTPAYCDNLVHPHPKM
eukprot:1970423-Pyramimonas_sp.AAC.1